jgi:hypothetical protein
MQVMMHDEKSRVNSFSFGDMFRCLSMPAGPGQHFHGFSRLIFFLLPSTDAALPYAAGEITHENGQFAEIPQSISDNRLRSS